MAKIKYIQKVFQAASMEIISQANEIIAEYEKQGFRLTLRQLYYQFVARDLLPNTVQSYKRLGSIIGDARLAGLIDWYAIEDRTRSLASLTHWESAAEILRACVQNYRIDKWEYQDYRPEVWIEKEALAGVIEGICQQLDVPYLSCRGYTSLSEMWSSGRRLARTISRKQTPVILHFGDHDPSGIDMTRDIEDRLRLFMGGVEIRRLALTFEQVENFKPPPNPAKMTDSRFAAYVELYGEESWELDALEPSVIVGLIYDTVIALRDKKRWEEALDREREGRERLAEAATGME